jgi:precorrin-6B methylase 2
VTKPAGSTVHRALLLSTWAGEKVEERWTDRHFRRHGLDTSDQDRGLYDAGSDSLAYLPAPWRALRQALPAGRLGPGDALLDYGAGRGRVAIWAASRFPLRRVVGVELDPGLHAAAQSNLERWDGPRPCRTVELVCADARDFEVPDDITVVFFYNPFVGQTFRTVLDNIAASLLRRPRRLTIAYVYPVMNDALVSAGWGVEGHQVNRSWVCTQSADGSSVPVSPWLPPYAWAIYRRSQDRAS